ncbi:hypoxanthine phosphoribosyltransferase [Thermosulfuriphilus ammonigenes]|uniref:Hypoxanthine phosphoribosyltransferase n=1 Tax=Thermosulfuriphilus ammonigenes TaxID=1936021 RepID=A0A6G7PY28_9BACT|nr:hypoxanthine phosphoribosyltransferase [Thermosulfuriphilus ammonigenes]
MMAELRLLISPEEIATRVAELGEEISRDHSGHPLVLVGILKGAFIFMADLCRAIKIPHEIDFVRLASYGSGTTSGEITITKDIELPVAGKEVIVVEDIIDTGRTLLYLEDVIKLHRPAVVKRCCLIDKPERRQVDIFIDYVGFHVPRGFLVGYGLDYAERYRHLPGIYEVLGV